MDGSVVGIIWHHTMIDSDQYPHVFGKPTDCWCEPEVDVLSEEHEAVSHRVIRHQDMTGKEAKLWTTMK